MNVRTVPYGYCYESGVLQPHIEESIILKEIFQAYLSHESLLSIANRLNTRKVEYREGVVGWNKSRISRLLQDGRYSGAKRYPILIERSMYEQVQSLLNTKNKQKGVDRKSMIFLIDVPVLCPACHGKMHRRCDNQYTFKERWACTNKKCKKMIIKSDDAFLKELAEIIQGLIENPHQICVSANSGMLNDSDRRRASKEMVNMRCGGEIRKELLKAKILEYAAFIYEGIDPIVSKTQRLIDIYSHENKTNEFPVKLLSQTAEFISFDANENLYIILTNGKQIRR